VVAATHRATEHANKCISLCPVLVPVPVLHAPPISEETERISPRSARVSATLIRRLMAT
jgi:hypothetical protein